LLITSQVLSLRVLTIALETFRAMLGPETRVDLSNDGLNTYNYVAFGNKVKNLAMKGLFGCTAVIVVSRKGAWMGHFWEEPYFLRDLPGSDEFTKAVLDVMEHGGPADLPKLQYRNQWAIRDLRNNGPGGPNDLGHMFDDVNEPWVIVVAPRQRDQGADAPFSYGLAVNNIMARLRSIFPGLGRMWSRAYSPITRKDNPNFGPGGAGPNDYPDFGDLGFNSERGKVLIQYQPAPHACDPNDPFTPPPLAKWRLWIEGTSKLTK
jgi:hypothetical protein